MIRRPNGHPRRKRMRFPVAKKDARAKERDTAGTGDEDG